MDFAKHSCSTNLETTNRTKSRQSKIKFGFLVRGETWGTRRGGRRSTRGGNRSIRSKLEYIGKTSPIRVENQQIQHTYSIDTRIKPRPHWLNASALPSASTLRMLLTKLHPLLRFDESLSFISIYLCHFFLFMIHSELSPTSVLESMTQ